MTNTEGGLVDTFLEQRAKRIDDLRAPVDLRSWRVMAGVALKAAFSNVSADLMAAINESPRSLAGLQVFDRARQQELYRLDRTHNDELELVRNSREHQLALAGFTKEVTHFPSMARSFDRTPFSSVKEYVAEQQALLGDDEVVVETGGIYLGGGHIHHLPVNAISVYVRRPETQPQQA